ncbi:MAG: alpha/beta hydrolase [Armatimonadetes bacterium]|nr:alpha/beta hydrolase [Armatimonadota bacterium]
MNIERNVVYATKGSQELSADLFFPPQSKSGPFVVFLHGGGWISGMRGMYEDEAFWLYTQGIPSATIDYRLAPLNPFPASVGDVQDFISWARKNLKNYRFDPTYILVIGNSAGGHLALMSALCDTYYGDLEPSAQIKADGAFAMCPITDLTEPRSQHFPISWPFLEQFMGSLDAPVEQLRAASPLYNVSETDSPIVLLHGTEDDIVPCEQSKRLAGALEAVGVPVTLDLLPGESHSFSYAGWMRIREQFLSFIRTFETPTVGAQ